jgi:hypothetical protein
MTVADFRYLPRANHVMLLRAGRRVTPFHRCIVPKNRAV